MISNNKLAIFLIIISVFCGTLMLTFLKLAQEEVNVYVAMLLYFSALVMMPIEKATAISFVVPFIVTILAVLFLGEKIYIYRSFALVLGFIGMLIILRPGIIEISLGVYLALASSFMWSIVIIITKTIAKDDSSITILSYGYTYMTIFSFIIALFYWQTPSFQTLIYLFFAGLFGTLLHLCINHAYKLVDVSMTQPYSFLSLVFASLIGYYVFSETPDLFTWIGASVIFLGVLIMSYREMKLDKEIIRKRIDIKS